MGGVQGSEHYQVQGGVQRRGIQDADGRIARYNFDYAVEVFHYRCDVPITFYSKSWRQTLRVMLHVSGEWTVQGDAVLAATTQTVSMEGRRRLRGRPRIVAGSWHAPFEKWRSLLWYGTRVGPTD
eukprot:9503097-Pyramimonas_sp.AAC.2